MSQEVQTSELRWSTEKKKEADDAQGRGSSNGCGRVLAAVVSTAMLANLLYLWPIVPRCTHGTAESQGALSQRLRCELVESRLLLKMRDAGDS